MVLDKYDIELLYALFVNRKISPIESFKIQDIIDNTELKSSYYTYVRRIQSKLMQMGYVNEGIKESRAKTYYISSEGIKYLQENILDKEDVYEYIELNDEEDIDNE